jgi:hypothetical protein
VRVARTGNVYIALAGSREGVKVPDGIVPGQPCDFKWGMLIRFDSAFDKFPAGHIYGTYKGGWDIPLPTGTTGPVYASWGKKVLAPVRWDYAGVAPLHPATGDCVCYNSRFDLDGFDRAWVPMSINFSVNALDANGNVILRVGSYGNPDSRGKDSPVVDPKTGLLRPRRAGDPTDLKAPRELSEQIGFRAPRFVAASDEALYVNDTFNQRIARCTLGYAAEEAVPLP